MREQWVRLSQNEQLAVMVAIVLLAAVLCGWLCPTGRKAFWIGFAVGVAFVVWKTWPAYYTALAGPYPANLANSKMLIIGIGAGAAPAGRRHSWSCSAGRLWSEEQEIQGVGPAVSAVRELEQDVGVARVFQSARADEVFAAQFLRIQSFLDKMVAIEELRSLAPSASLISRFHVRLGAQCVDVPLAKRVVPFAALTDENRVLREDVPQIGAPKAYGPYVCVESHGP